LNYLAYIATHLIAKTPWALCEEPQELESDTAPLVSITRTLLDFHDNSIKYNTKMSGQPENSMESATNSSRTKFSFSGLLEMTRKTFSRGALNASDGGGTTDPNDEWEVPDANTGGWESSVGLETPALQKGWKVDNFVIHLIHGSKLVKEEVLLDHYLVS
jgi:hypothetical protein